VIIRHQPAWCANPEILDPDSTEKLFCQRGMRSIIVSLYAECTRDNAKDGRFGGAVVAYTPLADRDAAE
jgi:hypothetical protein